MDKEHILNEIRRTAEANGGTPLGHRKFLTETGIRAADWEGVYWARWSDAVREAGFSPNEKTSAYKEADLTEQYILLIRKLGGLPTPVDLKMEARVNQTFPSEKTFRTRFRTKLELVKMVRDYCQSKDGYEDIIALCEAYRPPFRESGSESAPADDADDLETGYVYLMKSGKNYKIGLSKAPGRREAEVVLQLPERVEKIHEISTDDMRGIERYWHNRFKAKRLNGEWFALNKADVMAFKRRKFM